MAIKMELQLMLTTATATYIVDRAVSDHNTATTLHIDNLIDRIDTVSSTVEWHTARAAIYQLLILQHPVIARSQQYIISKSVNKVNPNNFSPLTLLDGW